MCQLCGDGWRFETTELGGLGAGRVKAVLHPISAEWENLYSAPSDGSITLAVEDPALEDIWAGSTGLYISQVMKDGSRRCRFGGYIVKDNGVGGGTGRVSLKSIDSFLYKRIVGGPDGGYRLTAQFIDDPGVITYLSVEKPTAPGVYAPLYTNGAVTANRASLGAFLVDLGRGGLEGEGFTGIPTLTGEVIEPSSPFSYQYQAIINWWDFKNIGQWINELVTMEQGIKYRLEHTFNNGYWSTVMQFADEIGTARDYTILSDREAKEYALEIDAEEKATRVYGVGSGEGENTLFSVAYDADEDDNLPEHQESVAWKDVADPDAINRLTRGYVTDHRDPATIPTATLYGLPMYDPDEAGFDPQRGFPGPEILEPGDTFAVEIGYGFITVKDIEVKALGVAWALDNGEPAKRTLAMQPIIRANQSVRTQTPAKAVAPTQPIQQTVPKIPTSTPWPKPGLVSRVQTSDLTEISGMQMSATTPGYIWVLEDEKEAPDQVSLIQRSTGARAGYFNITGVSSVPWGDPEAIRLAKSTGKLVIADIGDNANNRPTSGANQPSLLVVNEPKGGNNKGTLPTTRYPIAYPGGLRVNAETLLIHPTTEQVFIVTKENTRARVYGFGPLSSMSTSNNVGTLVATLGISGVSDGTHSWNGEFAFFRTEKVAHTVVYDVSPWRKVGDIATPAMTKSEAITAESACAFLTTTEGINAPIYRVLIPKAYGATCNTPAGPEGTGTGGSGPNGPKVVPGQIINLQGWKLQLPYNES